MTLYNLTVQFQTILEMAEDTELDPQLIADTLEGVEGEIEVKLDSYGIVMNVRHLCSLPQRRFLLSDDILLLCR